MNRKLLELVHKGILCSVAVALLIVRVEIDANGNSEKPVVEETTEEETTEEVIVEEETIEDVELNAPVVEEETIGPVLEISDYDQYLLAKIAMAEAEAEDTVGKALVIRVVLNRVNSQKFPNTVEKVIFQYDQFSPIKNGRWDRVEPSADCWEALAMVINGWDESQGALYFESRGYGWHSETLDFLYKHGCHYFYGG